MNNQKKRFVTVALAICMVFASVAVLAPLCNLLTLPASAASTTVEKVELDYAYLSPVKQAPTFWDSPYAASRASQQYMLNKVTVAENCEIKTFSLYVKNAADAAKTMNFVVMPFDGDVRTSVGNPVIKIKLTLTANYSGYVNVAVPDDVTVGAGTWLYGFNQANHKSVAVGLAHGTMPENEDFTVGDMYYGQITENGAEPTVDPDYRILSYVGYEKKTGETEEILSENYTKLTKGKAHVILMGGQSNATGNTRIQDLQNPKAAYTEGYDNILINYNSDKTVARSSFEPVKLGQGRVDENYGALYGPEVGLADYLNSNFPGEKFYIIKAAFSGTALHDSWSATGSCYTSFVSIVQTALGQLEAEGLEPEIFAMCWMQGESDAITSQATMEQSMAYAANEADFFGRIRDRFRGYMAPGGMAVLDAAIYDGSGSDAPNCLWTLAGLINQQKRIHASLSQNNYFLDSNKTDIDPIDDYGFQEISGTIDLAHYDGDDMIELGQLFGKGIRRVIVNGGEQASAIAPVISRGKTAGASNGRTEAYYRANTLTDGRYGETPKNLSSRSSIGWVSNATAVPSNPTTLTVSLGETYQIKTVKIYAANPASNYRVEESYFPSDYEIQIYNGTEWQTVATQTDANLPYAEGAAMTYTLETPVDGSEVRMVISEDGCSGISMVGEIEIFGYSTTAQETREFEVDAESRDEIVVTLDNYSWIYGISPVGGATDAVYAVSDDGGLTWTETDFSEPAFANAIRVTVADGASVGAVSVTGVFGEPAAPAKEPIEPDTDPEWYPETEPETEAESVEESAEESAEETVAETVAESEISADSDAETEGKIETGAPADTDAAPADDGGCASVVGFGAVAVLASAAAAVLLKKKD